jgi:hypothetical protein
MSIIAWRMRSTNRFSLRISSPGLPSLPSAEAKPGQLLATLFREPDYRVSKMMSASPWW